MCPRAELELELKKKMFCFNTMEKLHDFREWAQGTQLKVGNLIR